ncbi:MAG: metallophosphoesterase family protein [Candidatus Kapabacteria bacterium]|nr:metallophosphoesterase family protein [Candidatus Kapabacteria bacterium]
MTFNYQNIKQGKILKKFERIFIFLLLILSNVYLSAADKNMNYQPYLQSVSEHSAIIMVESGSSDNIIIEYGENQTNLNQSSQTYLYKQCVDNKSSFMHRIKLTGLKSNSQYYYHIKNHTNNNAPFSFRTFVSTGTDFDFVCAGDCRSGTKPHSNIAKLIKSYSPLLCMYSGDLCYNGSYSSWIDEFFLPDEMKIIESAPFYNSIGNHEAGHNNTEIFTEAPESLSGHWDYYSFDCGDVHFLVLSTETTIDPGSKQYMFAKTDLENTKKKWKFVMFHKPAYCAGGHGEDKTMIEVSKKIFVPNKVDCVLTGHSHFYQRNEVNGIKHLVIGGGGAPLYNPKNNNYTKVTKKDYHFANFEVKSDKIQVTVINDKNEKIDQFEIKK